MIDNGKNCFYFLQTVWKGLICFAHLQSKLQKSLTWPMKNKSFWTKSIWVSKNGDFLAISNSVIRIQSNAPKWNYSQKLFKFRNISLFAPFRLLANNFFPDLLLKPVSTNFKAVYNYALFDTHINFSKKSDSKLQCLRALNAYAQNTRNFHAFCKK